jgi:hypothetical protein
VIGEGLVAAGLEGGGIAAGGGVKQVDRGQDRVGVLAGAAVVGVDFVLVSTSVVIMWVYVDVLFEMT